MKDGDSIYNFYAEKIYSAVGGTYSNLNYYTVCLDGDFTVEDLRKIADILEEYLNKMKELNVLN